MRGIIMSCLLVLILIAMATALSGDRRVCLKAGEKLPNREHPIYTCRHDLCIVCVNANNWPVSLSRCNDIPECGMLNGSVDQDPPDVTINSPQQGFVYHRGAVLFDLSLDEIGSIYYKDNIRGGNWRSLCVHCDHFQRAVRLHEGFNNLTFRVIDSRRNTAQREVGFFIDTLKPRIYGTLPARGMTNGEFEIEFNEANPASVTLLYEDREYHSKEADLSSCSVERDLWKCKVHANLASERVKYWFNVTDIAGKSVASRPLWLDVDTTPPEILDFEYHLQRTGAHFFFQINEEHFDKIRYIDESARRPSWKNFCMRLRDGICEGRIGLTGGSHALTFEVRDKAGNTEERDVVIGVV